MLVVRKCLHVIVSSQLGAAATVQNTLHATINVAFQVCKLESFLIMLEGQDCLVRRTEQDHESGGSGLVQVEGLSKGEKKESPASSCWSWEGAHVCGAPDISNICHLFIQ